MEFKEKLQEEINRSIFELKKHQSDDGAFRYNFVGGPMTDANFIILMRVLEEPDEDLIKALVERLLLNQYENGAWKLFEDSEGHLSATIEAYTALLFSGYVKRSEDSMKRAERFILSHGGLNKAHPSTKFMLVLNGLYPWPLMFPFPLFIIGLPNWFPLSFQKFSAYVRAHFSSVLILGFFRFSIQNNWAPDLSNLMIKKKTRWPKVLLSRICRPLSRIFSKKFINRASSMTLSLQGEDGTVQGYASATFYFIYALLALGYTKDSLPIKRAINGLKNFLTRTDKGYHLQNSPSTVWDTALATYALHTATNYSEQACEFKAIRFLMDVKGRQSNIGGWPFFENAPNSTDLDDTQAVLRALVPFVDQSKEIEETFKKGVNWLLAYQNQDGGFSSFEKNKSSTLFAFLPIQNLKDTLIDPSTPDLTGRVLEFLGTYLKMSKNEIQTKKAINWLLQHQEINGSWYGRWGVSYIYGTWAALTGLQSVGVPISHPAIIKSHTWLERIQNEDGGWGESCQSDEKRTYIPLGFSTLVQTAWAVDALIAVSPSPTPSINRGIKFLLQKSSLTSKQIQYPNGAGLPGQYYIYYQSYPSIWPLLALSHYRSKYL